MVEDKPETNGPVTQPRVKHTVRGLRATSQPAGGCCCCCPSCVVTILRTILEPTPVGGSYPLCPFPHLPPIPKTHWPLHLRAEGLASLTHVPTDTSAKASRTNVHVVHRWIWQLTNQTRITPLLVLFPNR